MTDWVQKPCNFRFVFSFLLGGLHVLQDGHCARQDEAYDDPCKSSFSCHGDPLGGRVFEFGQEPESPGDRRQGIGEDFKNDKEDAVHCEDNCTEYRLPRSHLANSCSRSRSREVSSKSTSDNRIAAGHPSPVGTWCSVQWRICPMANILMAAIS